MLRAAISAATTVARKKRVSLRSLSLSVPSCCRLRFGSAVDEEEGPCTLPPANDTRSQHSSLLGLRQYYSTAPVSETCETTTSSTRRNNSSLAQSNDSFHEPEEHVTDNGSSSSNRPLGAASNSSSKQEEDAKQRKQRQRLERIRNVGIMAHVDAGKTTVTERMLALAGVVRNVGRVDTGNTVTDFLPAERERGITIQSAAAVFDWGWHHADYHVIPSSSSSSDLDFSIPQDRVRVHLIDTPGHVDFSVEVHRSVAVLDGAVLVVDAVAGVQAQTETVWKTMNESRQHALPCLVVVNKMDKEGCSFNSAIQSIRQKLPEANPMPIQVPLFRVQTQHTDNCLGIPNLLAIPHESNVDYGLGDFAGVLDLIHMRIILYPETPTSQHSNVESCAPEVYPLLYGGGSGPYSSIDGIEDKLIDPDCPLTQTALQARHALVEQLASECQDQLMEEFYLEDAMPSPRDLQLAVRKATLHHKAVPVLAAAALRGKGVEPLLDCIADLLPSPLDRPAPELMDFNNNNHNHNNDDANNNPNSVALQKRREYLPAATNNDTKSLGHPMHDELLAFAFKVCHLSGGRGGSGDGRVVFCRVYSGTLRERDVLHVLSPPTKGEEMLHQSPEIRKERVGGMLELHGGAFTNKQDGVCYAGDVCALVGLKGVVTGDTLVLAKKSNSKKKPKTNSSDSSNYVCLAGVASPKPVLQVRLEAETQQEQTRLGDCLKLLTVEDPSLCVEETDSGTLLSGLGELHIEVTLDRLYREFGLSVHKGAPRVAYRETLLSAVETPNRTLFNYDRTVGDIRMQAAVHLRLEPCDNLSAAEDETRIPLEPLVAVAPGVMEYLHLNPKASHDECMMKSPVYKALVQGCQGALRRGPIGSHSMANITCYVEEIDAEEGLAGLQALPGALRAAAMNAVSVTLNNHIDQCRALEPAMNVEISIPNDMVGTVLSDLTSRRGTVENVLSGDETGKNSLNRKTMITAQVPLVEILGYANALRSLTGGEGNFTAEYKGHAVCNEGYI